MYLMVAAPEGSPGLPEGGRVCVRLTLEAESTFALELGRYLLREAFRDHPS